MTKTWNCHPTFNHDYTCKNKGIMQMSFIKKINKYLPTIYLNFIAYKYYLHAYYLYTYLGILVVDRSY
jgi:hypothetical protein